MYIDTHIWIEGMTIFDVLNSCWQFWNDGGHDSSKAIFKQVISQNVIKGI